MADALRYEENLRLRKDGQAEQAEKAEVTPLNERVATVRDAIIRLENDRIACETFLNSPNLTDSPAMDRPIKEMRARISSLKRAVEELENLKTDDDDFDGKVKSVLDQHFS